jgi:hypothetical protein
MARRQVIGAGIAGSALIVAVIATVAFAFADTDESRFTGDATVDGIVQEIDNGDVESLLERARLQHVPCARALDGEPASSVLPPACPLGAAEGAPQEVFLSGTCQDAWIPADQVPAAFQERFAAPSLTYAVLFMDGEAQEEASVLSQYRIVYGRPAEPGFAYSGHVAILDGDIVQLSTACASVPEQIAALQQAGGEPHYVSPELDAATPVPFGP